MKNYSLSAKLLEELSEIRRRIVELEALENERKEAEVALRESEEKYRLVVESANEAIVVAQDGMLKFFNPKAMEITGCSFQELTLTPFAELIHPSDREVVVQNYLRRLKGEKFVEVYPFKIIDRKGEIKWLEINAVLITWMGKPATLNFLTDVTDRKQKEGELLYLTNHDALTGLYNRAFFQQELARMERSRQYPISVVIADVDWLKETNDRYGHAAGDRLLQMAAAVLREAFRAVDVVARIGGDEFAVLLPDTDAKAVEESLVRIRKNLMSHDHHEGTPYLSLSLGKATAESGERLADALKKADQLMYHVKHSAGSRIAATRIPLAG